MLRIVNVLVAIQPLGVEVLSADVDGVGSLMDGMTNLPSVNSVFSLGSGTAPTPMSSVTGVRVPSFPRDLVDHGGITYQCYRHLLLLPLFPVEVCSVETLVCWMVVIRWVILGGGEHSPCSSKDAQIR